VSIAKIGARARHNKNFSLTGGKLERTDARCVAAGGRFAQIVTTCVEIFVTFGMTGATPAAVEPKMEHTGPRTL